MTYDELKRKFPNASESFLQRNSDDRKPSPPVAFLPDRDAKHGAGGALEPTHKRPKSGARSPRYCVTFIAVRARELDDDNLIAGCKQLRDVVAAHLGLPDDKKSIRFGYGQVVSVGEQGTIVIIEKLL